MNFLINLLLVLLIIFGVIDPTKVTEPQVTQLQMGKGEEQMSEHDIDYNIRAVEYMIQIRSGPAMYSPNDFLLDELKIIHKNLLMDREGMGITGDVKKFEPPLVVWDLDLRLEINNASIQAMEKAVEYYKDDEQMKAQAEKALEQALQERDRLNNQVNSR